VHVEVGARGSGVVGGPQAQAVAAPEHLERGRGGKLRGREGTRHVEQILHTPELYLRRSKIRLFESYDYIIKKAAAG